MCLRSVTADYVARVSARHIGSEVFGLAEPDDPYVARVEIWIDGNLDHVASLPMKNTDRRWNRPEIPHAGRTPYG